MGTISGISNSDLYQTSNPQAARTVASADSANNSAQSRADLFSAVEKENELSVAMQYVEMQRMSLKVGFQQTNTDITADSAGTSGSSGGVQLAFAFDAEVRSEELALFTERTGASASKMNGAQRATYLEASRQVAVRFQMSATLSGQVLNGFSSATEALEGADGQLVDKWLGLAQDALQSDDIANQIFELLDGFFSGKTSGKDLEKGFNKLMDDLFTAFFGKSEAAGIKSGKSSGVVGIQLEFQFEFSASVKVTEAEIQQSDPITFDLDGDGIELTSYKQGARFDITGSGRVVQTAFVTGGDGFLAIDRNGNGMIDNGTELFGDQNGAANGYEELAKYDSNGDSIINAKDKDFGKLLLFKDNGNARTESGELMSLGAAGITEMSLKYTNVSLRTSGGNSIAQIASYRRADGSTGQTADSILNFKI